MDEGREREILDQIVDDGRRFTTAAEETTTMGELHAILATLDEPARLRAWLWAGQRFGLIPPPRFSEPGQGIGGVFPFDLRRPGT